MLGVEPILINSALVSAQQRKRLYWTNIQGIEQPEDKVVLLKDIIKDGVVDRDKSYCLDANYWKGTTPVHYAKHHVRQIVFRNSDTLEDFNELVDLIKEGVKFIPINNDSVTSQVDFLGAIESENVSALW